VHYIHYIHYKRYKVTNIFLARPTIAYTGALAHSSLKHKTSIGLYSIHIMADLLLSFPLSGVRILVVRNLPTDPQLRSASFQSKNYTYAGPQSAFYACPRLRPGVYGYVQDMLHMLFRTIIFFVSVSQPSVLFT